MPFPYTFPIDLEFFTPWSGELKRGTYQVVMPSTYEGYTFEKWEDNSTNPTRTITITQNMAITAYYTLGLILKKWSQTGHLAHVFRNPFKTLKYARTLRTLHDFHRPFRTLKFTQTLNSIHVFLRHRTFRLTQTLQTLHQWTLPIPAALKKWIAALQTTQIFKRPYRRIGYTQQLRAVHVFGRPVRVIRFPATLQLTHIFNRPYRFILLLNQLNLRHAYFMAVPGVKKTRLFLVIGDLAIQLLGD